MRYPIIVGVLLLLSACRKDPPPKIPICIGDGVGGADCKLEDGSRAYRSPTELKNAWITTQQGMALFSAWCYDAKIEVIQAEMMRVQREIQEPVAP